MCDLLKSNMTVHDFFYKQQVDDTLELLLSII